MKRSEVDHLVVACAVLDDGVEWIEQQLGARPSPGGQHQAMATHNALLKLGARSYLEVIAIDPDAEPPTHPRWFALDEPEMQTQLAAGPRLITWAIRCESLATACARVPDLGEIISMSRSGERRAAPSSSLAPAGGGQEATEGEPKFEFRWKIAVPETGALPWGGVLPAAIQWLPAGDDDGPARHPCDVLEDSSCELVRLQLSHPAAVLGSSGILGMFRALKIVGPVDLVPGPKMLAATIRTPRGEVLLG